MPTNISIQSATGSGRSVKQTSQRQWNWSFLTMQSNSMERGTKRTWSGIQDEGPEIINELVEL
jgi:hypothetical protein